MLDLNGKKNKWIKKPLVQDSEGKVYYEDTQIAKIATYGIIFYMKRRTKHNINLYESFIELVPKDVKISVEYAVSHKAVSFVIEGRPIKVIIPKGVFEAAVKKHGSIINAVKFSL